MSLAATSASSTFLGLPPEIRIRIYGLVFGTIDFELGYTSTDVCCEVCGREHGFTRFGNLNAGRKDEDKVGWKFLFVTINRRIHSEASPVLQDAINELDLSYPFVSEDDAWCEIQVEQFDLEQKIPLGKLKAVHLSGVCARNGRLVQIRSTSTHLSRGATTMISRTLDPLTIAPSVSLCAMQVSTESGTKKYGDSDQIP